MDRSKDRWLALLTGLILATATAAVYWPVIHHDFINCDDQSYVYENPALQAGLSWQGVVWAFTTGYAGNWHPVTWLSHILDVQWFGLKAGWHHLTNLLLHVANTWLLFLVLKRMTGTLWRSAVVAALFGLHPLHVESVAWIAERKDVLSALFFFLTLYAYARYAEARGLLFQVQGLKSENRKPKTEGNPKTEIRIQRDGSRITQQRSLFFYLLALVFFACGLMSKPMLVTLPFVLLLLDYWPLKRSAKCRVQSAELEGRKGKEGGRSAEGGGRRAELGTRKDGALGERRPTTQDGALGERRPTFDGETLSIPWLRLVVEKLPFFALAAASSMVTFLVQQRAGAVAAVGTLPLEQRLENAVVAYLLYLIKTVWPSGLTIFYPYRFALAGESVIFAVLVLIIISALAWIFLRQRPYVAVGWFWFLGTLVPVIGIVQVGQQAMADRYTYIPLIGVFIGLTWGVAELLGAREARPGVGQEGAEESMPSDGRAAQIESDIQHPTSNIQHPKAGIQDLESNNQQPQTKVRAAIGIAAVVIVGCAVLTRAQVGHWQDSETLFRHTLAVTSVNALAEDSLGDALAALGRVEEAEPHFAEAVRIQPKYPEALCNLGLTRVMHGKLDEGIALYRASIAVKPSDWKTHNNLARALSLQGKFEEAVREYQIALELNPGATDTRGFLAASLVELGKNNEAMAVFEEALKLKPNDAAVHFKYASLLLVLGQTDAAALHFRAALQYGPGNAETHRRYGLLLSGSGNPREAVEQFREAIRLQPGAEVHYNLAAALLQQGEPEQAAEAYRESLKLKPDSPAVLNDLAWLLAASANDRVRNGTEAVTLAERACELTQSRESLLVGTLAAAYAEAGRFADAVKAAEKAIDLATAAGQQAVADRNRQLLEFYRSGKPFHETRP